MAKRTNRQPDGIMPAMSSQCKTCIFRSDKNRTELAPDRVLEITEYLIKGTPHRCHTADQGKGEYRACRGGRDLQLRVWAAKGVISEPTDEALEVAYRGHLESKR